MIRATNLKKSIDEDPALLLQHGFSLHQAGRIEEASAIYKKILTKDSKHFDALQLLGTAYLHSKNFAQALEHFNKAIECNPRNAGTFNNRGIALKI